jgi:hypothetical protein
MNLNPISEEGMGFCFIAIDEYWERFEKKGKPERNKEARCDEKDCIGFNVRYSAYSAEFGNSAYGEWMCS